MEKRFSVKANEVTLWEQKDSLQNLGNRNIQLFACMTRLLGNGPGCIKYCVERSLRVILIIALSDGSR